MIERILADGWALLGIIYLLTVSAFVPLLMWCTARWNRYRDAMWRDYVRRQRAAGLPVSPRRAA